MTHSTSIAGLIGLVCLAGIAARVTPSAAGATNVVTLRLDGAAGTPAPPAATPRAASHFLAQARTFYEHVIDTSQFSELGAFNRIYPGIDVVCYGDRHHFEYVFTLQAGADPGLIRMVLDNTRIVTVSAEGHIVYAGNGFEAYQHAPVVYRLTPAGQEHIAARYSLDFGSAVGLGLSTLTPAERESLNGSAFNVVPGGTNSFGPDYEFFMAKYEVTNEQLLRFLNSAESNPNNAFGTNMTFDAQGNAWINPVMKNNRDELFGVNRSQLVYDPGQPLGRRYRHRLDPRGNPRWSNHPATGISWFGAVKYCNWLTLQSGRGAGQRCYREGTNTWDWAPVTSTNWANGYFSAAERQSLLDFQGFRLPMFQTDGGLTATNTYNEYLKAATLHGASNTVYGFGRNNLTEYDANTLQAALLHRGDTLPVGYFDGRNALGRNQTRRDGNAFGIADLTGNVAEWVNDLGRGGVPDARAMCGGSFADMPFPAALASMERPSNLGPSGGFRPVTTYMPPQHIRIHVLICFHRPGGMLPEDESLFGPRWHATPGYLPPIERGDGTDAQRPVPPPAGIPGRPDAPSTGSAIASPGIVYAPVTPGIEPPIVPPTLPPTGGGGSGFQPPPPPPPPPPPQVRLDILSNNPDRGIVIAVSRPDSLGRADGVTQFSRFYLSNSVVTVTAPATVDGNVFQYWMRNGLPYTTRLALTVELIADLQLTAVYLTPAPPQEWNVTVRSLNPDGGVTVSASTTDNTGQGSGSTVFERRYYDGTNVVFVAPTNAEGKSFQFWLRNGQPYDNTPDIGLVVKDNVSLTAVYGDAPPPGERYLSVESINPDSGVAIDVTVPDKDGQGGGSTTFVRRYDFGATVGLAAPLVAAGNTFKHWLRNGSVFSPNPNIELALVAHTLMTAVYESPPPDITLRVFSANPDAGVSIGVSTPDKNGAGNGNTTFARTYDAGTATTLTAPLTADGNDFKYWLINGLPVTTNTVLPLELHADMDVTAVYIPPAQPTDTWLLNIRSHNPDTGVAIVVSMPDYNGHTDGTSAFTRLYEDGRSTRLTAPATAPNGNVFKHWLLDGALYSTNPSVPIIMTANHTLTAVYDTPAPPPRHTLTVKSRNPDSAVTVQISPADVNALANGATPFERLYDHGTPVTLTASDPAVPGSANTFKQWLLNGVPYSTDPTITIPMLADVEVTAVYGDPIPEADHTLTVQSRDPISGVTIAIDTTDKNGQGNGNTAFTRLYPYGTQVGLTAPPVAPNGNGFVEWQRNGMPFSTDHGVTVEMVGDVTLRAVYAPFVARRLTVESTDPASGVPITVSTPDLDAQGNGTTRFERRYRDGEPVTLTAPGVAPNGSIFQHWELDGIPIQNERVLDLVMLRDMTVRAVYSPQPTATLAVRSLNPDTAVPIQVSTPDLNGLADGATAFDRLYAAGQATRVTAPATAPNGNTFKHWLLDGAIYSTNPSVPIIMRANHTLTAVYDDPAPPLQHTLAVKSKDPDAAIAVQISPADVNGLATGATPFERLYDHGTPVRLTASDPAVPGSANTFKQWLLNGAPYSTDQTITIPMLADVEVTAIYGDPIPEADHTLTVQSRDPDSGVAIAIDTTDKNGQGNGDTAFTRLYPYGTQVGLTAPPVAPNGNGFVEWQRNGVPFSTDRGVTVEMVGDVTLRAVYAPFVARRLTVESADPASGVPITVSTPDLDAQGNGTTRFERRYRDGEPVTLTAPGVAPNGSIFQHWELDGIPIQNERILDLVMLRDMTVRAVYSPQPTATLAVRSLNPDAAVPIQVSTPDLNGLADGATAFDRLYAAGQATRVTAPATAPNGNTFKHWLLDGAIYSTNPSVPIIMRANHTLTAVYDDPAPPLQHTLSVKSKDPDAAIPVQISPADVNGLATGATPFERLYDHGTPVTLTASDSAGPGSANTFKQWLLNGAPYSTDPTITIPMLADVEVTAVYGDPIPEADHTLTVQSGDPDSGVAITIDTTDKNGQGAGNTAFTRLYDHGTQVGLTAPPVAPNGNVFVAWQLNGVPFSTDRGVTVEMISDMTLRAVYEPLVVRRLTVQSKDPNSGVPIAVSKPDLDAQVDGATRFERRYLDGEPVTLTAPAVAPNGSIFQHWELDGIPIQNERVLDLVMLRDMTVRAVYSPQPTATLAVRSLNPDAAVPIQVSTPDLNGLADGATAFDRLYAAGQATRVTAPATAPNGNTFKHWLLDGVIYSTNPSVPIIMSANHTLTAVYDDPAPPLQHTLSVKSKDPDAAIAVQISPADVNGLATGATPFERLYDHGTPVTLTASDPAVPGSANTFKQWLLNGVPYSTDPTITIPMLADVEVTAVYGDPIPEADHTLTVQSRDPDSGVAIAIDTTDKNGQGAGDTTFTRLYPYGTQVGLTAPPVAPNGNGFVEWQRNGVPFSTDRHVDVEMVGDVTLRAVYAPFVARRLTVESTDPASGVPITVSTPDLDAQGNGATRFERRYRDGEPVTLTAPGVAPNGSIFQHWELDGIPIQNERVIDLVMLRDMTVRAVYSPQSTATLTIRSLNPDADVPIQVSTPDLNGLADGATAFDRLYAAGQATRVTAPATAPNGNTFKHWLLDGAIYSTDPSVPIIMSANRILTAVYDDPAPPPRHTLSVKSMYPDRLVVVQVSPTDVNGLGSGATPFDRLYDHGIVVTLKARDPAIPGSNNSFKQWLLNGEPYSTDPTITIPMLADVEVTAVYGDPIPEADHTLTVQSQDPDSGVTIAIDTTDKNGQGDGDTTFTRLYGFGTTVAVTAPLVASNGNVFVAWQRNGVPFSTDRGITVEMVSDVTLRALYEPLVVHRLTVQSQDPGAGVPITVSAPDLDALGDGSTTFDRHYLDGQPVTLTAPAIAPNGFVFQHWELDGAPIATELVLDLVMLRDMTVRAVYTAPTTVTLAVRSVNPDKGLPVQISTPDLDGRTDGVTAFDRLYDPGTATQLSAPAVNADGATFKHWLRNGVIQTTNAVTQIEILTDIEMTAVYGEVTPPPHLLVVRSSNPNLDVPISISPPDMRGRADGATPFLRMYEDGTQVTAVAPATAADGQPFRQWLLDGLPLITNRTVGVMMTDDHELIAEFGDPVQPDERTLTVSSRNPNSNVAILIGLPDKNGNTDGTTTFTRTYNAGDQVTVTAPYASGTNNTAFVEWLLNGQPYSTERAIDITMFSDMHLTAVYGALPADITLTVQSRNPDAGVFINVSPGDKLGQFGGETTYTRTYDYATTVTLTAPVEAAGTNRFSHWEFGAGDVVGTNPVVSVTLLTNVTMTAVYGPGPQPETVRLTVKSQNPDSAAKITVTSDIHSRGEGKTTFEREYNYGRNVTLTAPSTADGKVFSHWIRGSGIVVGSNRTITIDMYSDITMTAVYIEPQTCPTGL